MIRILLFSFFICSFLDASILKKIEFFKTNNSELKIEDIKDSKDFKRTKLPIIRHESGNYFIKLTFDKSKIGNKSYSVELLSAFNIMEIDKNISYLDIYKNKVIDQSFDSFNEVVYLKVLSSSDYINFDLDIYESNEYASLQILIGKLFGVSYGIIFAAFLYYLAFYLFNKQKSYILYSLTQLSMLFMLWGIVSPIEIGDDKYVMDTIFVFFFISSNFFTRAFLNTKENAPRIDKVLKLILWLYIGVTCFSWFTGSSIIQDNVPMSIFLIFYLLAGYIIYQQGSKPALFYLLGWSVVIISFLVVEAQIFFSESRLFMKPVYIIHISAPLESLILAFALSYKMKILEEEKLQQQEFLTHQSKLASMGEMIGNIAHQWRQPLTHLSYIMMNLKTAYEKDRLSSEYFEKKTSEATAQLNYMSHTIDDFRDFFKVSKEKVDFSIPQSIDEVITLLKATFKNHSIEVKFLYEKDISINNYKGEFLQVLFNILNNAKDEFIKQEIENPQLIITLLEDEKNITIKIADNAKGIDEAIIDKIFEPYFTTKDKGLGIGLYMSNMIINKMSGKLSVENENNGACFKIEFLKA